MSRTVLIVDDHAGFRAMARALLESGGYRVVGEAPDGASALSSVAALLPDLVLLDIQLPDMDGFEVTKQIARGGHVPVVVLISGRLASTFASRLATSPARAFISKADLSPAAIDALLAP